MVKPGKFGYLHLAYHFTIPLNIFYDDEIITYVHTLLLFFHIFLNRLYLAFHNTFTIEQG